MATPLPRFRLKALSLVLISAAALLVAGPARATDTALAAASGKTAITGVYAGQSVIRFANPHSDKPARLTVDVYGVSDKAMLGRFELEVPAKASVQVRPEEALQTFAPVNWDQLVVLYVASNRDKQLWQHVRHNIVSGDLTNASVCTSAGAGNAPPANFVLNASLARYFVMGPVEPYASFISLHNTADAAVTYEARLYDALTGEMKGRVDVPLDPRGTFNQSSQWYQNQSGWYFPTARQKHMNIEFVRKDGMAAAEDLVVGHVLMNVIEGDSANLSNPCPVRAGLVTPPPEG